jgi:predicted metal-binding protein
MMELLKQLETSSLSVNRIWPGAFIFDDRAKLKCYFCPKYGKNYRCPPNIPDLDYRRMIRNCSEAVLFCYKQLFEGEITLESRRKSSQALHKAILKAEDILWQNNYPLAISFIGGSCKLCGCICPDEECAKPEESRIMLEAIGVDITATAATVDVKIVYPPKGHYIRVGAVLW